MQNMAGHITQCTCTCNPTIRASSRDDKTLLYGVQWQVRVKRSPSSMCCDAVLSGAFSPCGQIGRSVAHPLLPFPPISPFHIHSQTRSVLRLMLPDYPFEESTSAEAASLGQQTGFVNGVSQRLRQYTCLPLSWRLP